MHYKNKKKLKEFTILLFGLYCLQYILAQHKPLPFSIQSGLFDHSQPNTLGLVFAPDTKTYTIFHPQDNTDKYNNGVVLVAFKGYLYAQWQSSSRDEDADDTWVAYSRSSNGRNWTKPMTLAPKWDKGICTSGGWWTDGKKLVAYINIWPHTSIQEGAIQNI
jgi:hypothetical protein